MVRMFTYFSSEEEGSGCYTISMKQIKRMEGVESVHVNYCSVNAEL